MWTTVFSEIYKEQGATRAQIETFKATVLAPLTSSEVSEINLEQGNLFPVDDASHASFQPFDPEEWVLPRPVFSPRYLEFLRWSNGGEFRTGDRWFQFFGTDDPTGGVRAMLLAFNIPEHMPMALPFAFNGGGTFYMFDMRRPPVEGEFPIVCSHAGSLGWQASESYLVATSFEEVCRGIEDVDDMGRSGRV